MARPMEPASTGNSVAKKEKKHSASSANLKGSPSALKRRDSFASSSTTRKPRNANDTTSDELLKK